GEIEAKGTLKKGFLPPRWRLLMGQIIQCLGGKTGGFDFLSKLNMKSREKVVPYPSAHNWELKINQPEGPPFTKHMLDICKADAPVAFKAPKPSSKAEKKVTQGTKPGATSG
ncbi:hypothetical protein Tco_0661300, partial [Tanacetum coccineum]